VYRAPNTTLSNKVDKCKFNFWPLWIRFHFFRVNGFPFMTSFHFANKLFGVLSSHSDSGAR
jgi:hypothetical protein